MTASDSASPFGIWFRRLVSARNRGRAARTVELFGWLLLAEGAMLVFATEMFAGLLGITVSLEGGGAAYLRLIGVVAFGVGILYTVSGRLGAEGFVFATLLDRPLVPPAMAAMWLLGILPGSLALAFALQEGGGFLWTLFVWRTEQRAGTASNGVR